MIDACCSASCTWPRSTQPTLSTLCCSSNPVQSVTPGSGGACCLTRLDGRCSVSSTVSIVCVHLWSSPLLACYRETVTLSSSNTTVNVMFLQYVKIKKYVKHKTPPTCLSSYIYETQSYFWKVCIKKLAVAKRPCDYCVKQFWPDVTRRRYDAHNNKIGLSWTSVT